MYLSQSLAVLTDDYIIPQRLVTQSVALFMFIITIIGGNVPLLIPYLCSNVVGYTAKVNIHFTAASVYTEADATGRLLRTPCVGFLCWRQNTQLLLYFFYNCLVS